MPDDAPVTPEAPEGPEPANDVDSLPEWARTALTKANKEAANYRSKLREAEPLAKRAREIEEASKTESQRLAEARATAEQETVTARRDAMRFQVALAKGVPADLVDFLTGDSEGDIAAKADVLLARLVPARTTVPPGRPLEALRPGAVPSDAIPADDMNAQIRRSLGR